MHYLQQVLLLSVTLIFTEKAQCVGKIIVLDTTIRLYCWPS